MIEPAVARWLPKAAAPVGKRAAPLAAEGVVYATGGYPRQATVAVRATVGNDDRASRFVEVETAIVDASGSEVARSTPAAVALAAGALFLFPALYVLFRTFKGERPFSAIDRRG